MKMKLEYIFGFLGLVCTVTLAEAPCGLPPFSPSNSAKEIISSLNKIVTFAEAHIVQMTKKKERLEKDMVATEKQSTTLSKEKIVKSKRSGELKTKSEGLRVSIDKTKKNKANMEGKLRSTQHQILSAQRGIDAAARKVASLQASINQKNREIAHLNAKIEKEKHKRRCGLGKKRKRRSAMPRAWRRFRVRVRFRGRRFIRNVGRAVRKVGRVVKEVVTVVNPAACLINNIVSRLRRTKERAERDKRNLMNALSAAHRDSRRWQGEKRRLALLKGTYETQVRNINKSLAALSRSLNANNRLKAQVDKEINSLTTRITTITAALVRLDIELKDIRERKSMALQILSELKREASDKLADMKELKEADKDEMEDLLQDIKLINERIKLSVANLRKLICDRAKVSTLPRLHPFVKRVPHKFLPHSMVRNL